MNLSSPPPTAPATSRRKIAWFPLIVLALGAIGLITVLLQDDLDRNIQHWILGGLPILVGILLALWFLLSRRFRGRTRLIGLAVMIVLVVAAKLSLKVDGTLDGTGLPNLSWRWNKARPALAVPKDLAGEKVAADPRLAAAMEVPEFFGKSRSGHAPAHPDLKLAGNWQQTPPVELWRQPVGEGWSSFAVSGGRAFTQEQRGEEEVVSCYELLTGRLMWVHADKARFSQWQSGDGPHATPTLHAGRVYAYGATGLLTCLEAETGQKVWQQAVLQSNQWENLEWGISASPLIVNDTVVVTGGNTTGPILVAYSLSDGTPVWKEGQDRATYASPALVNLAGRTVLLASHAKALTAHDPSTGKVLMQFAWGSEKWPKATQPVVIGPDLIFLSAGYGVGCRMLRVKPAGDLLEAEEVWANLKLKTQFNSPAYRDGHLYGLDDGKFSCLDATSGERLWKEGRFGSGQSLLVQDLAIIQAEDGSVSLAAAKPEGFELRGTLKALSSKTWNFPVLSGRYLLVRNDREAVCYELPVEP